MAVLQRRHQVGVLMLRSGSIKEEDLHLLLPKKLLALRSECASYEYEV